MSAHNWDRRRRKRKQKRIKREELRRVKQHDGGLPIKTSRRNDMPRRHARPSISKSDGNHSVRSGKPKAGTKSRRPPKRPRYHQQKRPMVSR